MRLGTTTWPLRAVDQIGEIMQRAAAGGLARPVILVVGPGGMSGIGRWLHPIGRSSTWTRGERVFRGLGRFADNLARSLPLLRVTSPEMELVYLASLALQPQKLVFVDVEERVLDAGRRFARLMGQPELFRFRNINIVERDLDEDADIVIAHGVLERVSDPAAGLRRLCDALKPGGWLCVSATETIPGFRRIARNIFQKDGPSP
jgi:SAM-dependent methyltransferase